MEKIVYTRCSPWIDLLNQGKIVRQEGFGAAATSSGFFSAPINFKLLKRIIEDRKGDMNVFDKIYEYVEIGNGEYAFVCSGELPLCKEARKNGAGHRPIFMAEALIGKFNANPALYMTPENFKGDQLSQNDYYRMDLGPETMPMTLNAMEEGALEKGSIFFPLSPERQKGIASVIAYVLAELVKPESKRTVLFIKGNNEEVMGYIDTVARCLPAKLANKLTFLTHTSSFKSNPERYSYYSLTQTGEVMEYNPYADESLKANRKLKYQIVGFTQGVISRTPRSEFHLLDTTTGQATFDLVPNAFITALAGGDPAARRCLAYINEHLNGEMPADPDSFYAFYKTVMAAVGKPAKAELENGIRFFLSSNLGPQVKQTLIDMVKENYDELLEEDLNASFSLLSLASRLDPSMAMILMPKIKDKVAALLDDFMNHPEAVSVYETLARANLLAPIEEELLKNHVSADYLAKIVSECPDAAIMDFYFRLYQQRLSKGMDAKLDEASKEKMVQTYGKMLLRYSNNPANLALIDNLLKPFGEKRDALYVNAINEAYKQGRTDVLDSYLKLYKPGLDYKATQLALAEMIKDLTFGMFETKLIKAYNSDPVNAKTYIETILALFEVYPDAKRKELYSGLVFAKNMLDAIKDPIKPESMKAALDYLLKLKAIRGELPEEIIHGLEDRLMKFVLQGGSLAGIENELKELGIPRPAMLSKLKDDILKAGSAGDQQKIFEAFYKEAPYPIQPSDLRLPYFMTMLKALKYEKSFVHASFLCAFSGEEPRDIVGSYLTVLRQAKSVDGMVFYHSLCLILALDNVSPKVEKIQQAIDALLKPKDNGIITECFDRKYDRRLNEFTEANPIYKKAKDKLVADFTEYGNTHKGGLFSRIFGKK